MRKCFCNKIFASLFLTCRVFSVSVVENGVNETSGGSMVAAANSSGPSDDTETDNGPADTPSSDGEPVNPAPKRRHRRRTPRSEPGHRDSSHDDKPVVVRKPLRAKSQPPISSKEIRRSSSRLDWTERHTEVRRTPNEVSVHLTEHTFKQTGSKLNKQQ